jgi:tRNA modification GTPase
VICGRPNVGKSSLYNRIVGRDAAIVTEIEGTTRDVVTETASLGRVTLRLFDTAGLHETEDPVERIGIARAERALEDAELVLAVFDGSHSLTDADRSLIERLKKTSVTVIALCNQTDRGSGSAQEISSIFTHTVSISAKTGDGMDRFSALVERLFVDGELDCRRDAVLANARQHASALSALEAVRRAVAVLREGYPIDLCCTDAEAAMSSLCEVDGRQVNEDIVGEIFSKFCVGK